MKNLQISILFILACAAPGWAQQKSTSTTHDAHGNPIRYSVTTLSANVNVVLEADAFTKAIASFNYPPNQPFTNLVYLQGTKEIRLMAYVHKDSLSFYRYRLTENDRDSLISRAIPQKASYLYPFGSDQPALAVIDLGRFRIENKKLKLTFYKISDGNKVNTVIFYNKPIKPAEPLLVYLHKRLKKGGYGYEMNNLPQGVTIAAADDLKGMLFSIKHTDLNFIYHVFLKNKTTGQQVALGNNWLYDFIAGHPYIRINASHFREKGDYELKVVPVLSAHHKARPLHHKATVFRFSVEQETTFSKSEITSLLAAIFLVCGITFGALKIRSHKRLTREQQEKERAQLQLNLVRSQLNPHFMFNALASIQNLMNKNDTDNANRYLGKFARLTRQVLKNQEFIPLEEETALLEDYLQMEKLRFGFHYAILLQDAIDAANVEIPAMLLQPFVENAVKHGVSGLQAKGQITIRMERNDQDLILLVIDNGSGFSPDAKVMGLGSDLSRRRIALLNKVYKNTPILLNIKSDGSGTEVKISLRHWLAYESTAGR